MRGNLASASAQQRARQFQANLVNAFRVVELIGLVEIEQRVLSRSDNTAAAELRHMQ